MQAHGHALTPADGWRRMVTGDRREAACVMCGGIHLKLRRVTQVAALLQVLDSQRECGVVDSVHEWVRNVLQSVDAAGESMVVVCGECFAWQSRREKRTPQILPLQAMLWYVRTLVHHTDTDGRIVQRIARMLAQPSNYYAGLLTQTEVGLCACIASSPVQHVQQLVTEHMHRMNASSLFVSMSKTAEVLREVRKHGVRTRRRRVLVRPQRLLLS